jgi:hypothetical protein
MQNIFLFQHENNNYFLFPELIFNVLSEKYKDLFQN